ncbi:acyltransferase [Rugosimonospora acidiphila]|uniref:Acyltransferase n=1 Tax=Rugosimonospora acidiphila TaxID=556531 RepID=A0ABP9RY01_9ACTN
MALADALAAPLVRPTPKRTGSRVDWIDRLRIWLTVLVVAHHAADTYATISDWYVPEPGRDASAFGLTVFLTVNQTYFMGLFFLLSGLFVPRSADRKGLGRFTRDRLLRLGVPIVAYVVVIRPLCLIYAAIYLNRRAAANGHSFSIARYLAFGGDPGVTWFLEVLLAFTLGYVLIRLCLGRLARTRVGRHGDTAPEGVPVRAPRPWMLLAFAGVLAAATLAWHWLTPSGSYWPGVGLPSPDYLPQYLLFFVAGVAASRRGWLDRLSRWYAIPAGLAALFGVVLYAPVVGQPVGLAQLSTGVATAVGQTLFAIGSTILLVLLFRTVFARPAGRLTRLLANQSMAVYVTHPAVLVAVAVALRPLAAPSAVKAAILFAISAPLCWAVAWLLRRIRVVRAVV